MLIRVPVIGSHTKVLRGPIRKSPLLDERTEFSNFPSWMLMEVTREWSLVKGSKKILSRAFIMP